ncbi:F-box protein Pof13 [Schizosaccharomyces cryophilus OY26]|uniref:F-box protein Pof13 n=1 Tax=Schizosaccharomyces cryophilus (strain OY26 / ATCC MYA-4695 / CBS 11777 / NBRC 106824 / NRRL Y48691) TaxID=653667 RepID=S9X1S7_SCHCR|nr:F-box protein Pof13 [Schizosaccharomyces cryophilus OY26]EPY51062.1 F-box protein Pof13 [Schizosaccharomyces cryophilus OY26]
MELSSSIYDKELEYTTKSLTALSIQKHEGSVEPGQSISKRFLTNRDIWSLIVHYLDVFDLYRLMHVNRHFYHWLQKCRLEECRFTDASPTELPYQKTISAANDELWAYEKQLYGRPSILRPHIQDPFVCSMLEKFQGLSTIVLDGTGIKSSTVAFILSNIPTLRTLSIRWCQGVSVLSLLELLQAVAKNKVFSLERFYVMGIDGLELQKPLLPDGTEDDRLTSNWHSRLVVFQSALDQMTTTHGRPIETDVHRCPLNACKIADQESELADSYMLKVLPPCVYCSQKWSKPLCRYCIDLRRCMVCGAFICPSCLSLDFDLQMQAFARQHRVISTLTDIYPEREDTCYHKTRAIKWHQLSPRSLVFQFQEQNHIHHRRIRRNLLLSGWSWPSAVKVILAQEHSSR